MEENSTKKIKSSYDDKSLNELPYDTISHLFSFLQTKNLFNLRFVNKLFNESFLLTSTWTFRCLKIVNIPSKEDVSVFEETMKNLTEKIQVVSLFIKNIYEFVFNPKLTRLTDIKIKKDEIICVVFFSNLKKIYQKLNLKSLVISYYDIDSEVEPLLFDPKNTSKDEHKCQLNSLTLKRNVEKTRNEVYMLRKEKDRLLNTFEVYQIQLTSSITEFYYYPPREFSDSSIGENLVNILSQKQLKNLRKLIFISDFNNLFTKKSVSHIGKNYNLKILELNLVSYESLYYLFSCYPRVEKLMIEVFSDTTEGISQKRERLNGLNLKNLKIKGFKVILFDPYIPIDYSNFELFKKLGQDFNFSSINVLEFGEGGGLFRNYGSFFDQIEQLKKLKVIAPKRFDKYEVNCVKDWNNEESFIKNLSKKFGFTLKKLHLKINIKISYSYKFNFQNFPTFPQLSFLKLEFFCTNFHLWMLGGMQKKKYCEIPIRSLKTIVNVLPNLEKLSLKNVIFLGYYNFKASSDQGLKLKELKLISFNIKPVVYDDIVNYCPNLQLLKLKFSCDDVFFDISFMDLLFFKMKTLKTLRIVFKGLKEKEPSVKDTELSTSFIDCNLHIHVSDNKNSNIIPNNIFLNFEKMNFLLFKKIIMFFFEKKIINFEMSKFEFSCSINKLERERNSLRRKEKNENEELYFNFVKRLILHLKPKTHV